MGTKRPLEQSAEPGAWVLRFQDVTSLKNVFEAAAAIESQVVFRVQNMQDVFYLKVEGCDIVHTCGIFARILIDEVDGVFFSEDTVPELEFCIDCKYFLYAIDNPSCAHGTVTVQGNDNSSHVQVTVQDPDCPSSLDTSTLATMLEHEDAMDGDFHFDFLLEVELVKMKETIRKARRFKAEHLRVSIYIEKVGAATRSLVVYSLEGETGNCHEQKFCHDVVMEQDGSQRTRAVSDGTMPILDTVGKEPAFSDRYIVDKLDAFLKTVPGRVIIAKASKGIPLLFERSLNGSTEADSYIRFMIAPSVD